MSKLDAHSKVVLEDLLAQGLLKAGISLGADGEPAADADQLQAAAPVILAHLVGVLADDAEPTLDAQPDNKPHDAEPAQPKSPEELFAPLAGRLKDNLEQALGKYVTKAREAHQESPVGTWGQADAHANAAASGDGDGDEEINVDADFIKDSGGQILTDLFGAFAKALVPEEVALDLPSADASRKVRVNLHSLIAGLTMSEEIDTFEPDQPNHPAEDNHPGKNRE